MRRTGTLLFIVAATPRFLLPGLWTLGVETDVIFQSNSAGLGVQARYMHGLSDLMNIGGYVGTGSSGRGFRFGGHATLDFFPDTDQQLGIGMGGQVGYVATAAGAQVDVRAIPYIHRRLTSKRNEIEPFGGISIGPTFGLAGTVIGATAVAGSLFEVYSQLVFTVELGVGIANEQTYLAGGLTYFAK